MSNKKYVNGVLVDMTADEIAARQAEETEWANGASARNIKELRFERDLKLAKTDWVVTMHKELGTNIPAAMKTYRQALRDITDSATSLDDVTWPEKP